MQAAPTMLLGRACMALTSWLFLLRPALGLDMSDIKCIKEAGMKFEEVVMVNRKNFDRYTIEECVAYCMVNEPAYSHVLISYHDSFWKDKFNCICASEDAFKTNTVVQEYQCSEYCPGSRYRCGHEHSDLLSVYCLKKGCSAAKDDLVCEERLPHDHHGCVKGSSVDWKNSHNVRNFSASSDDNSACVWECKDNHPRSLYSLTRVVGDTLTCSCAYGVAFDPAEMIGSEFCNMIHISSTDYYHVNCVSDLDEKPGNKPSTCSRRGAIGCVYEELLEDAGDSSSTKHHFTVSLQADTTVEEVNVEYCGRGCDAMFGSEGRYSYTGVRYDAGRQEMSCWCLTKGAFNSSMVGPDVECTNECGYRGSHAPCGGYRITSAVSLFCSLPMKEMDGRSRRPAAKEERSLGPEDRAGLVEVTAPDSELSSVAAVKSLFQDFLPLLDSLREVSRKEVRSSEAILALLIVTCLIVTVSVTYFCFSNGVAHLTSIMA